MKKRIYFFISLLLLCSIGKSQCPTGNVVLSTQQQVNDFAANYPTCTQISGDLVIGFAAGSTNSNITSLAPLTNISTVTGNLTIRRNGSLSNLGGLNNLASIGIRFTIQLNGQLQNVDALSALASVGERMSIQSNESLTNLNGLNALTNVGENLRILTNGALENINGFNSLETIGGNLLIDTNNELLTIDGLNSLESVGGSIELLSNEFLESIDGLNSITSIGEILNLDSNINLIKLGFSSLNSVGEIIMIGNNELESLEGLSSITTISGGILIEINHTLTDISDLQNINISGLTNLTIKNNSNLAVCNLPNFCAYLSVPTNPRTIVGNAADCISSQAIIDACLAGCSPTIWDGNTWSDGLPDSGKSAIIDGELVLNGNLTVCELEVTANGQLTIPTNITLEINGKITNSIAANFIVESGAHLIQTNEYTDANLGEITVYRDSQPMVRNDMTLWSSPVTGQSIREFSEGTLYNRFWIYDEPNSIYSPLFTDDTQDQNFETGAGYAIRVRNTLPTGESEVKEGQFVGIPHNGTVNIPVTALGGGYNLIGNPYPSNISANDPDTGFFAVNSDVEAVYFWTHQYPINTPNYSNNYATFSLAGGNRDDLDFISAGQGFFVKVASAGNIEFNNEMRATSTATFYKNEEQPERHRIWISISDEEQKLDQFLLAYMNGASNDFDKQIDAKFIQKGEVAIYSLIEDEQFAIQGRTLPFESTDIVPLGFQVVASGIYTITLENTDGLFAEGEQVFIKDNLLNITHNISESAYTFETESGEFNNRFEVVYEEDETMNIEDINLNTVRIYKNGETIMVSSKSERIISVELYDLQGRNIYRNDKVNSTHYQVNPSLKGVLVVKVQTQDGKTFTKKVRINN